MLLDYEHPILSCHDDVPIPGGAAPATLGDGAAPIPNNAASLSVQFSNLNEIKPHSFALRNGITTPPFRIEGYFPRG